MPSFADRAGWLDRVAASIAAVGAQFGADRMVARVRRGLLPPRTPSPLTTLPVAGPYSFELSTERFRAFGLDLANAWHEDALYRSSAGARFASPRRRRRRRRAARRRDPAGRPRRCSACRSSSSRSTRSPRATGSCSASWRRSTASGRRSRRSRSRRSSRRSRRSRSRCARRSRSATGSSTATAARAASTRSASRPASMIAGLEEDDLFALGFSHRQGAVRPRAGPLRRSISARSARCPTRRSTPCCARCRGSASGRSDWFLARHLARPRAWPAGDLALRKAASRFYRGLDQALTFRSRRHAPWETASTVPEPDRALPPDRREAAA